VGGWIGGWMGGWMEVKAVLRIAYSNQKLFDNFRLDHFIRDKRETNPFRRDEKHFSTKQTDLKLSNMFVEGVDGWNIKQ
jgi:hypothetical protein